MKRQATIIQKALPEPSAGNSSSLPTIKRAREWVDERKMEQDGSGAVVLAARRGTARRRVSLDAEKAGTLCSTVSACVRNSEIQSAMCASCAFANTDRQ